MMPTLEPSYLSLYNSGKLRERVEELEASLSCCKLCPRNCGVDRTQGELGFCLSGYLPLVASFCDHHGEEPPISGIRGSGTFFFANCDLRCVFCQNYEISQNPKAQEKNAVTIEELGEIMLYLQNSLGCHNINLVTPSHFIPQIARALLLAIPRGLRIPLVYNTNGYDSLTTLSKIDGIIDIYLPDMKYASDQAAQRLSRAPNYVDIARASIKEMHRQVGKLMLNDKGVALRGLLVRHLILPHNMSQSEEVLRWLAKEFGPEVNLSLMAQYKPLFKAKYYPEIDHRISREEYKAVLRLARELGFKNLWVQGTDSPDIYLPHFDDKEHPFTA